MKKLWEKFWLFILRFAYRRAARPMPRKPLGLPLLRDPDFPCDAFEPRRPRPGDFTDCQTDGHYLCRECCHRDPQIEMEIVEFEL